MVSVDLIHSWAAVHIMQKKVDIFRALPALKIGIDFIYLLRKLHAVFANAVCWDIY